MTTARLTPVGTLPTAHRASEATVISPAARRVDEPTAHGQRLSLPPAPAASVLPGHAPRARLRLAA